MNTGCSREAYDLWNPACREHFRRALKMRWHCGRWWALVWSDTRKHVCTATPKP